LTFPVTPRVEPSKVRFSSTVPLGADPFKVIIPLFVVPVRARSPDVPDVPEEPLVPEEPDVPEDPDVPDDPLTPDVPEEPLVPADPDVPADPERPLVPADPDVPDVPAEPLAPIIVSLRTLNDPVSPALFITR
jgi:hypothetical protein